MADMRNARIIIGCKRLSEVLLHMHCTFASDGLVLILGTHLAAGWIEPHHPVVELRNFLGFRTTAIVRGRFTRSVFYPGFGSRIEDDFVRSRDMASWGLYALGQGSASLVLERLQILAGEAAVMDRRWKPRPTVRISCSLQWNQLTLSMRCDGWNLHLPRIRANHPPKRCFSQSLLLPRGTLEPRLPVPREAPCMACSAFGSFSNDGHTTNSSARLTAVSRFFRWARANSAYPLTKSHPMHVISVQTWPVQARHLALRSVFSGVNLGPN